MPSRCPKHGSATVIRGQHQQRSVAGAAELRHCWTVSGRPSFAGNLTDQPEVRYTEGGIARAMLRVGRERSAGAGPSLFTVVVERPGRARSAAAEQGQPGGRGSAPVAELDGQGRQRPIRWPRSWGRAALGDGDAHQEHLGAVGIGRGVTRAQLADSARHASTSVIAWAVLWNSTACIPSRLAATTLASRSSRNTTSPGATPSRWHVIL